nr:serine hydrolase [uncultured Blautia sp.]
MAKEQIAVAELITNIILGKTENASRVEFFPQKPKFPFEEPYQQPFSRATPESQGISSDMLADLLRDLDTSDYTDMHHFMVLRNGRVICEANFAPYRSRIWHVTHSMCKSITGMAIGLLIEEGKLSLDENIYDIFQKNLNPFNKIFRPKVTVENLLTMTSGVTFNESGIISGNDWLTSYLNSSITGTPGENFLYNSLNSYVLSAIVTERTGQTLTEYLEPRLFAPLGITHYFWETCPKGITKGGWGLFLCTEDMAKLGQLYLQKGKWNGQQIIPEFWVEVSTAKHKESIEGTFGYGYQLWMEERPGSFEFNGMLGQNVIIYPDLDMVIVTNAGNNELFQNCVMLNIVRKYFPLDFHPAHILPENPCAQALLNRLTSELEKGTRNTQTLPALRKGGWKKNPSGLRRSSNARPNIWNYVKGIPEPNPYTLTQQLNGKVFELSPQSIGLFPLFIQIFHNNMTEGVQKLSFTCEKEDFSVNFLEAGQWHNIPIGFGRFKESWLTLHEESYLISASGEFTTDENGTPVLKLDFTFLEECVRRKINIFFLPEDEILIRWYETPGKSMIMEGLESITEEISNNFLYGAFKGAGGLNLLHKVMEQTIEPVSHGHLMLPSDNTEGGII